MNKIQYFEGMLLFTALLLLSVVVGFYLGEQISIIGTLMLMLLLGLGVILAMSMASVHHWSSELDDILSGIMDPQRAKNICGTLAGMKFTRILAGEFVMGSDARYHDDEYPAHKVTIARSFDLGTYQVTQREWESVMGSNPSRCRGDILKLSYNELKEVVKTETPASFRGDNHPVEMVSWYDVQRFIARLNKADPANNYRLPSEAEWEYACRAGTTSAFFFGDNSKLDDYAWRYQNSGNKTHPVGQKEPNHWGLYDICGNVSEWVQDRYHDNYVGAPIDGSAWTRGRARHRVVRGGSFIDGLKFRFASSYRLGRRRTYDDVGFRIVKESQKGGE